jgi:hypothetical protein
VKLDFGSKLPRCGWSDHWENGGTGVTRCWEQVANAMYLAIAESVRLFGDKAIWMEQDNRELHSSKRDLSDFWKFHRNRTEEAPQ